MILQLYDLNHTRIAGLKNFKDAVVESELSTGDKTLSFLWHQSNHQKIPQEYYVRTDKDEFVVKENSKASKGYRKIVAKLNVEEIEGRTWSEFIIEGCTAQEAADYALTDTGWSCISTVPAERLRKISMKKVNSFQILEKILEAFTCEVKFDTLSKVVYLMEQVGEDKGAYFIDGLNLREITDSGDSYDYATIIIPIGADGLEITEINGGKNYLENYQYSNKKKSVIWEDTSYIDPQALMEDAAYRLNEISKPKKTYRAKTIDLAKLNTKYSALAYSVGDTATFISNKDGIREKQRITKTVEYIDNPQKNTCDISNTVLSFEEMQKKLFAAAECIGNITTDNGTVRGSSVDKINVTQIIGLEHYIAEDVDDMKVNYLYVKNELGTPYAVIGEGVFTNIGTTNLNVNNRADIGTAYINELHVEEFTGDRASFKTVEADNIAALEARLNKITSTEITVEYLEANYSQVNFANVEKEYVKNLFVDIGLITDATIVDGHITGNLDSVNINANCITAGTLAVDRLMIRGSEDSLIYELNNITGALQAANVNTLNGEVLTPRTINCDRLVAGSITANEIASATITGDKLVAGSITAREIASATITGDKIAANTITAIKINVNDLFAQDITATGVIRGARLYGTYIETAGGKIGGFIIGANELYKGTSSMTSTTAGIYVGSGGIRQYNNANAYVNIANGKLTCAGADIKGSMYLNNDLMMWHGADAYGNAANYYKALGWEAYGDTYRLRVGKEECVMENLYVECSIHADQLSAGNVMVIGNLSTNGYGIYMNGFNSTFDSIQIRKSGSSGAQGLGVIAYSGSSSKYWLTLLDNNGNSNFPGTVAAKNFSTTGTITATGNITTSGAVTATGNIKTSSGNLGSSAAYTEGFDINKYWADSAVHNILTGDTDGLTTRLGWVGSSSYATVTIIRARTCRYQNSSGTTTLSDERLKEGFIQLEAYDDFFNSIEPCAFRMKNGSSGRYHIGYKAQQIEAALIKSGLTANDFAGFIKMPYKVDVDDPERTKLYSSVGICPGDTEYGLIYTEFTALNTYQIQKCNNRLLALETWQSEKELQLNAMQQQIYLLQNENLLLKQRISELVA